jgi:hypothetical protein
LNSLFYNSINVFGGSNKLSSTLKFLEIFF